MAGYPKIWTTIRHEPWFKKLNIGQRGIWYELMLISKEQKDDGTITFRNIGDFAVQLGADRHTVTTWLDREVASGRCECLEKGQGLIHLKLVQYNDSQQLRRYSPPGNQKSNSPQPERKHKPERKRKPEIFNSSYDELKSMNKNFSSKTEAERLKELYA